MRQHSQPHLDSPDQGLSMTHNRQNSQIMQNSLIGRIYGTGFQRDTMPSIIRPQNISNQKKNEVLMNAKLFPTKKGVLGVKLEPIGFYKQSNILETELERKSKIKMKLGNIVDSNKNQMQNKNEEKDDSLNISGALLHQNQKGMIRSSSQQVMIQQQILQSQNQDVHPLFKEKTQNLYQEMQILQLRLKERETGGKGLPLSFLKSPDNQDALQKSQIWRNTMGMSQLLANAPMKQEEIKQKKHLVDLISGKFDIDPRFNSKSKKMKKMLTEKNFEEQKLNDSGLQIEKEDEAEVQITYKRAPSKLDKYIDLILKNVRNVDEFIYLIKGNEDDPYDLKVVNYQMIRGEIQVGNSNTSKKAMAQKEIREYYTISKKGLCHYINSKPVEFIMLPYWLKERETYDQIKSLRFFQKFRKWKTLKMWKKNVIRYKINNVKNELRDKLFLLNQNLGKTLLSHKKQLAELSKLKFVDIGAQQYGISVEVPKLSQFKKTQENKRKFIMDQIQGYSKICRENVREGFKLCLDQLKKNQQSMNAEEDFTKQNNENQTALRLKESAYENLGFSDNMSYEQRSELRKECSKFLRFSYLIDFLAMESLRNIYLNSTNDLIKELTNQAKLETIIYLPEEKMIRQAHAQKDPLFFTKLELNQCEIPSEEIEVEIMPQYLAPPFGTSKKEDFSLIHHLYLREKKELTEEEKRKKAQQKKKKAGDEDSDSDNEELLDKIDETKTFEHAIVPNLYKLWLNLSPSLQDFNFTLVQAVTEGLNALKAFERWSRHDEMTPYVSVLEEWDDMVGDDWENPSTNYLNLNDWLKPDEIEDFGNRVKISLSSSFNRAYKQMKEFQGQLAMYYDNSQASLAIFKDEKLFQPIESLAQTLDLLEYQTYWLELFPTKMDMGLIRVDCEHLRSQLTPSPGNLMKQLNSSIPELILSRSKQYKGWLNDSSSKLKTISANIDDFVRQTNFLKLTEKTLPKMKYRITIAQQQYFKFRSCKLINYEFKKEDENLIQSEMNKGIEALVNAIQQAQESADKNAENFKAKIEKTLIPELEKAVNTLDNEVQDMKYLDNQIPADTAISELTALNQKLKVLEEDGTKFHYYQESLGLPPTHFQSLEDLRRSLDARLNMWQSLKDWKILKESWMQSKFNDINTEEIRAKSEHYSKIIGKSQREMPGNVVLDELRNLVNDFKNAMPIVIAMRNKNLQDYHWEEFKEVIGQSLEISDEFTLENLFKLNVLEEGVKEKIVEISTQATQENVLSVQFQDIYKLWENFELSIATKNDNNKELQVFTGIDLLTEFFDDELANLNNILGSRYLKRIRKKAEKLKQNIMKAQEIMDDFLICQKNWMYLQSIFSAQDIKKRLPDESKQFDKVDQTFRMDMKKAFQAKKLERFIFKTNNPKTLSKNLEVNKTTLSQIQQKLENYLEVKRQAFPRFYFLSNDELLEILAQSFDIQLLQKHIKKCFDNVIKLDINESLGNAIVGMISAENEIVSFGTHTVNTKSEVELWLNQFQDKMVFILKKKFKDAKTDFDERETRNEWILCGLWPAQTITTISQIQWALLTEIQIAKLETEKAALAEWVDFSYNQLSSLTDLVRGPLTDIQRRIVVALITQDVHQRDITEILLTENIDSVNNFVWQQQLRYYWDENDSSTTIFIKQVDAHLMYGFEYEGATTRLVITPLTDRCWMTITGALTIKLGANPAGPAGTGKTESTKDLAKGMAMFCVVFNCSEQIQYQIMQRLFSGLAQQGAWSCLDEFNRIDIEVLSVIAMQLRQIREALLRDDKTFKFVDSIIPIKPTVGVFITMNPGYAGRTELPDNLKVLFRPVAMMIPDYALIAEIMLFAEGFENAKQLSKKMVQLYKLSSEQLSQQRHYDFGMRAVKSVLVMAGALKRAEQDLNEDAVLIRAMRDSNIPKFLKDDLPLFNALIQDLFPGISIPQSEYTELSEVIQKQFKKKNLQYIKALEVKILQLYETFNVRFGVMIVGLTGSGKTTCYRVLKQTMTILRESGHSDQRYQKVVKKVLNPKCISMGELYGEVDEYSKEWHDGLASSIMRECANDETDVRQWVVFDGPVDALWIENMNTVLDDNMMLCLANGQRIKLRPQMRMLFEVNDLEVASPATVSRCGMVFMTQEDLGWQGYVTSWITKIFGKMQIQAKDKGKKKKQAKEEEEEEGEKEQDEQQQQQDESKKKKKKKKKDNKDNNEQEQKQQDDMIQGGYLTADQIKFLHGLFDSEVIELLLDKIRKDMKEPIPTTNLQLITSLCNLLEVFISDQFGFKKIKPEAQKRYISYAFAFAFIWSLGITVNEDFIRKIDTIVRDKFASIIFPNNTDVYGCFLDILDQEFSFKTWDEMKERMEFVYNDQVPYFNLLVPTSETVRFSFILEKLISVQKSIYVTGATGTGKSVLVSSTLREIRESLQVDPIYLIFSAQTKSDVTQLTIEQKLEKIKKTLLGAKPGHKVSIFIDDINMPAVEEYGAQPPIELLRTLIDKGGVYDRKELFWKSIQATSLLACSAPPGGGRNKLTQRFTRHFNILNVPQPTRLTLMKIFESILSGFLEGKLFDDEIKRSVSDITTSTIDVYERILKEKLPIPSKFHYTFNLRDVSKVFQGLLMVLPQSVKGAENFTRLWIHEIQRVFYDRLVNDDDRVWFENLIIELTQRNCRSKWQRQDIFLKNKIHFGDILKLEVLGPNGQRIYEEIKDHSKLTKVLIDKLEDYNSENTNKMELVFFDYAIDHILRISRVLRQPRGNVMLIGVGGSGKQSLVRLGSYMLGYQTKQIAITKKFDFKAFRQFVYEELIYPTGVEGAMITFLFTDTQIINESFLEDINNILNSGEVPNLIEQSEKDKIISDTRPYNDKLHRPNEPDQIYQTFIERVRDNLHIVLCMSPVGDSLRIRCRKFPSLVDCCTLDWFSSWPPEALFSVAGKMLEEYPFPKQVIRDGVTLMSKEIHQNVLEYADIFAEQLKRKVYQTPKTFIDFINLYKKVLEEKRDELQVNLRRLSGGLTKLAMAKQMVSELEVKLTALKPELEVQAEKVKVALVEVEKQTKEASVVEMDVERETNKVEEFQKEVQTKFDEVKAELDKVEPEMKAAQEKVENINKQDLITMRSFANPPGIVVTVMEGVCILFGEKNTDWNTSKKRMQDLNGFIKSLKEYPKDNISQDKIEKVKKLIANPEFDPAEVSKRVSAAGDICSWIMAMYNYSQVFKRVAPIRAEVDKMQRVLDQANAELNKKKSELQVVKDKVMKLKMESDEMIYKKEELESEQTRTTVRLESAEKLTSLLGGEGERWKESVGIIQEELTSLIGNVFLSTAAISYCGPFTGSFRIEMMEKWKQQAIENQIPASGSFSTGKTLCDPLTIRDWQMYGLPADNVSCENAIYSLYGNRWPLMIDPQLQAKKWIKNFFKEKDLKIMKESDQKLQIEMKGALQNGYPVLIQDVGQELAQLLDPILQRQVFTQDGRVLIHFGEQDVDYHQDYQLFITTKIPNPHYLPEIFIKVNIINFTVTFEGLEDQLLADVVKSEKPEVERQRDENIMNLAKYKRIMKESEQKILQLLDESKAENILDDTQLIRTLEVSKKMSEEIVVKIEESTELEEKIELTRSLYKSVSIRGSILFFVIKDLGLIDPMYQYSLQYVSQLFNTAISQTPAISDMDKRLVALINEITKHIYTNVSRGLFQEHKLIFSFLIIISIQIKQEQVQEDLWGIFLRGAGPYDNSKQPPPPERYILPFSELQWNLLFYLSIKFERFYDIHVDVLKNSQRWAEWTNSSELLLGELPGEWEEKLTLFEKLVLIKAFKPENVMFAITSYIESTIGKFYLEQPSVSISTLHKASRNVTPIIFILSQGADPTQQLINFAQETEMSKEHFFLISLGQGQEEPARKLIVEGLEKGNWVLLQNCHLSRSFMPRLEQLLEEQILESDAQIHKDFRLFLTSMPVEYFPVTVLQNGIKLTTEPPRGIRANIKRSFQDLTDEFLDSCPRGKIFHQLIFGLSYFHAIIQERRKFGPLGWNIRYEFNDSDLETSRTVLYNLLSANEDEIPWDAITFVTGHINYGGRVTDDWDRRCLLSVLRMFYNKNVAQEKFQFSRSDKYMIPALGNVDSYNQYIDSLPLLDDPEVFGMHENANITYQSQESDKILQTIISIQPIKSSGASGKSPDEIVKELAKLMYDELPGYLLKDNGAKDLFVENDMGLIPSLSTVLLQEMEKFNILLTKMKTTLIEVIKAIDGLVVMSQELDGMYQKVFNNQVPANWEAVAYPSLKPLVSWIKDLKARIKFLEQWLTTGRTACFWMSGFYFPQGFLTGVLQTHARKHQIAIDKLAFNFKIIEADIDLILAGPSEGVYIHGLFLEGAMWDRKKKTINNQLMGELYQQMPVIHFIPTDKPEVKDNEYICPVYKTSVRAGVLSTTGQSTNFILPVNIPSQLENPNFWTLRGAALLCQLND